MNQHVQNLLTFANERDVLRTLHELNVIVDSRTINGEQLVNLIRPSILLRRLTSNNSEEIKICIVLLKKLLSYVKPELIVAEYEEAAVQGLNHPSEAVREFCLRQVDRCVQTFSGLITVIESSDLLNFVIRSLSDSNMGCAKVACSILVCIGKYPDGLALLLDKTHQAEFEELMIKNDTVRFRVYDLFVKIVECNPGVFSQLRPLFNKMANEINSDDVLLQMNCVELLTDVISIGKSGFNLPEECGVSKKLYDILKSPESNPLSSLLIPVTIKFFGFLSAKEPHFVLERYPMFFDFIFNCIISNDHSLTAISLDTIGTIGLSNDGLRVLFQTESRHNILAKIGSCLQSSEEQLKTHCLDCLASLFTHDNTSDKNILDLIHILYSKLAANPLDLLFTVLKQPFHDVRRSSFRTFHSLVGYQWMLEDMKNIPGFVEYLLDRRTENEKECQELKYEVVKKMSISPYITSVFDKPSVLKLKQFVREGPFYAGSDVSVAMEEAQ